LWRRWTDARRFTDQGTQKLRIPTWSWAACHSSLLFRHHGTVVASFCHVRMLRGKFTKGEYDLPVDAKLNLQAPLIGDLTRVVCKCKRSDCVLANHSLRPHTSWIDGINATFDVMGHKGHIESGTGFAILQLRYHNPGLRFIGLMLRPRKGSLKVYERIGIVEVAFNSLRALVAPFVRICEIPMNRFPLHLHGKTRGDKGGSPSAPTTAELDKVCQIILTKAENPWIIHQLIPERIAEMMDDLGARLSDIDLV
jgi:hypothetical protein